MSEKVNTVISRILRLDAEKIDYLLESLGKVAFYAQEKGDKELGKLVEKSVNTYQDKFLEKTKAGLADLRGLKERV